MKTLLTISLFLIVFSGFSQSPVRTKALLEVDEHVVIEDIYFDYNKWTIRPESQARLDTLAMILLEEDSTIYEVQAHTDCRGSSKYSIRLSQRRAHSVAQYLISKGVPADRLVPKGYEENKPSTLEDGTELTCDFIFKQESKERQEMYHQMNRRVELLRLK